MAFQRLHSATADATFSATGAANWNANQVPSGADVGGIPYCPTATTETTSAKMVFDGTTFTLAMGSVTASPGAVLLSQTRNAVGTTFDGIIKAVITDTASAAGSLAMQILGGASGTTNLLSLAKDGSITAQASGSTASFVSVVATSTIQAATTFKFGTTGTILQSGADGVVRLANNATSQNVYLNTPADNVFAVNTSAAQGANASFRGKYQSSDGSAGVSFGPAGVASITVKDGIITAIS